MRTMLAFVFCLLPMAPGRVFAHCDGMDGPVVRAAQQALDAGDVNRVLIWVRTDDEPEIRKAFEDAAAVRKLGAGARELADRYFFETVVRVHRAGEGAPYTGLKPAGRDLGPAIPAADEAVERGSMERLLELLTHSIHAGLEKRFRAAAAKKNFDEGDVPAGREFVKAYVEWMHYVEGVYQAAAGAAHGHSAEPEGSTAHPHEH